MATMTRILDYTGQPVDRSTTVADITRLRSSGQRLTQITAGTTDEAAAAETAGIEMVVCMAGSVRAVRLGSSRVFVTAAIDFDGAVTEDDLLGDALTALSNGADAVITARGLRSVERLAHEDIPVMGHLGFVPKKSTRYGGIRAVGKTAAEATALWKDFQRLEAAGAFAVECELITADVMTEINRRTGLATISLGSGPDADVMFLFTSDICGESEHIPRHARTYGDLTSLHQQIIDARVSALTAFRADVEQRSFPDANETAALDPFELATFLTTLD